MHHQDPLLNESNADLLESLCDDDDKVRTMATTTTKQFAHDPIECRTHCLPRRQWGRHLLVHEYFFQLNVSPFSFGVKTPLQLLSTDFKDRYQMYGCLLLLHWWYRYSILSCPPPSNPSPFWSYVPSLTFYTILCQGDAVQPYYWNSLIIDNIIITLLPSSLPLSLALLVFPSFNVGCVC